MRNFLSSSYSLINHLEFREPPVIGATSSKPHAFCLYFQKVLFITSTTAFDLSGSPALCPLTLKSNCIWSKALGTGVWGGFFHDGSVNPSVSNTGEDKVSVER